MQWDNGGNDGWSLSHYQRVASASAIVSLGKTFYLS